MLTDLEAEKIRSVGLIEQLTQEKLKYVEEKCQETREGPLKSIEDEKNRFKEIQEKMNLEKYQEVISKFYEESKNKTQD